MLLRNIKYSEIALSSLTLYENLKTFFKTNTLFLCSIDIGLIKYAKQEGHRNFVLL